MKWLSTLVLVAAFLYAQSAGAATEYRAERYASEGVAISLDDPIGSVYRAGEEVGFSIQTDNDAYVVVFNIDTDGFVHLLYPENGQNLQRLSSKRAYHIPEDPGQSLVVGGAQGIEFVFALAVENRDHISDQEIRFLAEDHKLPANRRFRVTGDPFRAANTIASQLVRGISHRPDVTMSFTYFYIDEAVDFPRYLCEDCYEKGTDPYGSGMPTYVANADFEKTDRLVYPLDQGFISENEAASLSVDSEPQYGGNETQVTKVYVSYYPRWNDGFYDVSWWYFDPWYWDPWYYYPSPYYPYYWGWGVTIGWGWGWSACHYHYPYYWGGYYPYNYWWGYPDNYPGYGSDWRSFRPVPKGGSASALYAGMNYKGTRDVRARQYEQASPKGSVRTASDRHAGVNRTSGKLKYPLTGSEPRVIRSRPTRPPEGREGYSQGTRKVKPKAATQREQRVITRSGKSTRGDARGLERKAQETGRTIRDSKGSRVESSSRSGTSKSTSKRTYSPNVRRENSAGRTSVKGTQGRSGSSYGKPPSRSSPSSRSSAPPSRSSGSRGGGGSSSRGKR